MLSPHGVSKPVFPTSTASARERAARLCRAGERGCRSRCSCHGPLCCFLGFIPNKRCLELSSRSQIELRPLLSFGRQSANLPLLKICRWHRCFCTMLCWTASQLPAACVASSCYGCRVRRPACRNHANKDDLLPCHIPRFSYAPLPVELTRASRLALRRGNQRPPYTAMLPTRHPDPA